jgi:type VI secretion system Hcp family effector
MKPLLILFAGLFIFHALAIGQAALMTVEGDRQGKFKGESTTQRERNADKIEVYGITMEVGTGSDAGSVLASRRRQFQPLLVKKPTGAASPQFFQALVSNETLRRVVIEFRGYDANGQEMIIYTITLESVRVSNFKQVADIPVNGKSQSQGNFLFDEIKLSYQKITIESNTGKTMAVDQVNSLQ